ncbi:MAG: LpxI family protein [Amphiplicatus sp.]
MAGRGKLGVIAGGGALPLRIVEGCVRRGEAVYVIRLAGCAEAAMTAFPGEDCGLGEAGKIIGALRREGCERVALAGVVRRPSFRSLKLDGRGAALLPRVLAAATRGDGALLNLLVAELGAEGFRVVGAEEALGELAAPAGVMGAHAPSADDLADMRKAAALIAALGPFDAGQGAVVAGGLVLAVEAAEGTDAMLARCAAAPVPQGAARSARGVLVKRPKPGQDRRIDLPTLGVETVRRAHAAGLAGIAVEAGAALIVDADETIAEADRLSLFLYGFAPEEVRAS